MDITLTVPRLNETKQKLHKKPGAPSNKWPASYCWGKYGNTYELSLGQSPDLLGKASSVYERKKHSEAWQTQARGFGEKGSEPRPGWCVGGAEPVGNSGERERERLGQGPASAYGANHFHKKQSMSCVWCAQIHEPNVLYDNLTFSVFVETDLTETETAG